MVRCFVILLLSAIPVMAMADDECVLGTPISMLDSETFTLDKRKPWGTEKVRISADVEVEASNGGCESKSFVYRFILSEDYQLPRKGYDDDQIAEKAYDDAMKLLGALEQWSSRELNFEDEKKAFRNYRKLVAAPRLKEKLYIENRPELSFSETTMLDGDLQANPPYLVISTTSGPY